MDYLRTPDTCFENLPGYPWAPHYAQLFAAQELAAHAVQRQWQQRVWTLRYRDKYRAIVVRGLEAALRGPRVFVFRSFRGRCFRSYARVRFCPSLSTYT